MRKFKEMRKMSNMSRMCNRDEDLKKAILEIRDKFYRQAIEDAKDSGDEDYELRDHLETEYNKCDTDELIDSIQDQILDSFGS